MQVSHIHMNDNCRVCSKLSFHAYDTSDFSDTQFRMQSPAIEKPNYHYNDFCNAPLHILPPIISFCIFMTPNFTLFYFTLLPLLFTFLFLLTFTRLLLIDNHLHPPNSTIFIQIQPQWKPQVSLPYIKTYSSRLSLLFCPKNGGTRFLQSVGTATSTRRHQTQKAVSTSQCHKIFKKFSC